MNDKSTRAHALFILTLKQTKRNTNITKVSKMFLADLGGSEQVKKSQIDAGSSRVMGVDNNFSLGFELGQHMKEAVYINLALLALKKCIESLNKKSKYVPYSDSKLTMLLSSGLGGNSKTSIIVCGRMESSNISESMATLRFGEKCSLIENITINNNNMLINILIQLNSDINELEIIIKNKEKWILTSETRQDVNAEEGTVEMANAGLEIRKVTKLIGAEKERKQLELLLQRRDQFTGKFTIDEINTQINTKTIGFGKEMAELYNIGQKYDINLENEENERFEENVSKEKIPTAVIKEWKVETNIDSKVLETKAMKVKRNKLTYAGLS